MKMKLLKLFSVIAILAVVLFASCVDSSEKQDYYLIPGIAQTYNGKSMVLTAPGRVYSTALAGKVSDDDPVLITYQYDSDTPGQDDAKKNGYYLVTVSQLATLPSGIVGENTDTTTIAENEIALKEGIASYAYNNYAYLQEHLFLSSTYYGKTDQTLDWVLAFDFNEEPKESVEGNIYSVFLRAGVKTEGSGSVSDQKTMTAFNIREYVRYIEDYERTQKHNKFFLKVHFINEIKEDGTFTWTTAPYDLEIPVSEIN